MNKFGSSLFLLVFLLVTFDGMSAEEPVYPSIYNISSDYSLSSDMVALADTFVISRRLINDESFDFNGLYFSDNLPLEFSIIDQKIEVNGLEVEFETIGPISDHIIPGFDSYHWIIDSRGEFTGIDYIISPGDTVSMDLYIVCNTLGRFPLPSHTTVFYGNGSGFFATSDTVEVEIVLSLDVEDEDIPESLPGEYIISSAYPNPFNSSVKINFSGANLARRQLLFKIYDITGRTIHEISFMSCGNIGHIGWNVDETISSGIYFYSLTDGVRETGGKIILLK